MPMKKQCLTLILCLFLLGSGRGSDLWAQANSALSEEEPYIYLEFYSTKLALPALRGMEWTSQAKLGEAHFREAYTYFDQKEYYPFLKKIGDYRRGMALSDWHYYNLIADYSEKCFPKASRNAQILFQWFILRKSGINVQLFHTQSEIYLHALSKEIEFGFFIIEKGSKRYVNLTAKRSKLELNAVEVFMPEFQPDAASQPLVMKLGRLPNLANPRIIERLIAFKHRGEEIEVKVYLNRDHLQMMDDYPYYNQAAYFDIGLSREAETSLMPQLEELMQGKTSSEKIEFLLSFTRTAFFYKDDRRKYGKEKPMTPEQTLYHSYSDCEDRSALFYYLCQKLVGIPVIVLDFQTHVGTAVELPGITGNTFHYKGHKFIYCEATGPQDILQIGEMWDHVKNQKARILTEYLPQ